MMRSVVLFALCIAVSSCTIVRINSDDTESIEYKGGPEVAKDLTTRACRKAGQKNAEIISTVNKDPKLPPGQGRQITTFRCSSETKPPEQPSSNERA